MYSPGEMRDKPVRITGKGEIFIDGEQILADYPIADGSLSVTPWHGRLNQLTLTLLVGPVSVELKKVNATRTKSPTILCCPDAAHPRSG